MITIGISLRCLVIAFTMTLSIGDVSANDGKRTGDAKSDDKSKAVKRIEKFWTTQRMRNAKPEPMPNPIVPAGKAARPKDERAVVPPGSKGPKAASPAVGEPANGADAAKGIEKFWTPERMRDAKPAPMPNPIVPGRNAVKPDTGN